jgi:hypothetical protein
MSSLALNVRETSIGLDRVANRKPAVERLVSHYGDDVTVEPAVDVSRSSASKL